MSQLQGLVRRNSNKNTSQTLADLHENVHLCFTSQPECDDGSLHMMFESVWCIVSGSGGFQFQDE